MLRGLFDNIRSFFGWFDSIFRNKQAKICFLGCDNAGKTTLLQMLKEGKMAASIPTGYPTCEELVVKTAVGTINFRTFDLGGHETARRIWKDYYSSVDGIIFLVDAADRTRFAEASEELNRLLEDPCLANIPIAVLGNKIDIPVAASEDELRRSLRLYQHMTSGKDNGKTIEAQPRELFMVSIMKRMGYAEAFQWLPKFLN